MKKYPVACVQLGVVIFYGINSILNENKMKNHPVAGVQFCEVWDVPEQCEDHHWNDVDCTGEACEPKTREFFFRFVEYFELNILNINCTGEA